MAHKDDALGEDTYTIKMPYYERIRTVLITGEESGKNLIICAEDCRVYLCEESRAGHPVMVMLKDVKEGDDWSCTPAVADCGRLLIASKGYSDTLCSWDLTQGVDAVREPFLKYTPRNTPGTILEDVLAFVTDISVSPDGKRFIVARSLMHPRWCGIIQKAYSIYDVVTKKEIIPFPPGFRSGSFEDRDDFQRFAWSADGLSIFTIFDIQPYKSFRNLNLPLKWELPKDDQLKSCVIS